MSIGLTVSIQDHQNKRIVRLEGRIDATSTPILEKKMASLLEKEKQLVLMDFSKVDYLSSAGMRLLLSASKKIKAHGGKCLLCSMHEDVMEIIKMAGFERILSIYSTEAEALKPLER